MTEPRFDLYVKAPHDGSADGTDCPFSQRAWMFMLLRVPAGQFRVNKIDVMNKPDYFIEMNPAGTVPVLVDHQKYELKVTDSLLIIKYINKTVPGSRDLRVGYTGADDDTTYAYFGAFVELVHNKEDTAERRLSDELTVALRRFNDFLALEPQRRFICGNEPCDADCAALPKLNHMRVAALHYKQYVVPNELTHLRRYMDDGMSRDEFKRTRPSDQAIIKGWGRHL